MATRGDAYRNERGQRGGPAESWRDSAGTVAGARVTAPAARVADRYRLEDRISDSGQSTLWRAFDGLLGRAVTVRTFSPGFTRAAEVVAAARAACRVPDHRLARVFDAHVAADGAYIVTEWPDGESLEDLLAMGQLDVRWATRIMAEVASALATAHAAGLAHLRLTPRSVLWSRDVGVKITGLGVDAALADAARADAALAGPGLADPALADAALAGPGLVDAALADPGLVDPALADAAHAERTSSDVTPTARPGTAPAEAAAVAPPGPGMPPTGPALPGMPPAAVLPPTAPAANAAAIAALADTRSIAQVLYAALTRCWPGQQEITALPLAPRRDGRPYRPRQVRAGVPARIDEITCRALFEPLPRDPLPVTTPGQLAELLDSALYQESPQPANSAVPQDATFMDGTAAADSAGGFEASVIGLNPRPRHRVRALAAGGVVGALFFIDSALIGISIIGAAHAPHMIRPIAHSQRHARPRPAPGRLLRPVSDQAFDPYSAGDDENNKIAPAAIDGNPSTAWHTFWYTTPYFGNLKPGTGLLVDMGRDMTITDVRALFGAIPGADVQLRIGDSADSLGDMGVAATANDVGGLVNLRPVPAHRGRYVLMWFTRLPPAGSGRGVFQADIYEVTVYGS
jgi:eukaryotic-like serine/threonine-protein kinase